MPGIIDPHVHKRLVPKASTTVYSKGLVIPTKFESLNIILKTDLGTINWLELYKKLKKEKNNLFSLGAARLQIDWDLIKLAPEVHENLLKEKGVRLERVIVSGAFGFKISLNPLELGDFVD
jgi:hypothetical protein